jgi:predicted phosphodiesterase
MIIKNLGLYLILFLVTSSCSPFVDSPFSDTLLRPERNINATSIEQIKDIEADNLIRIAVFSDSHQNYKALDKASFAINAAEKIDFVAGLGDYTNSAYNLEYDQFLDGLQYLVPPKVLAIGNHDSIGAGPQLFKKAFGNPNFYFESTTYRFVFFDSNNLENPAGFDLDWLADAITTPKKVFIFSHVQLRDNERYFGSDATKLNAIITAANVQVIFNGHNHVYGLMTDNNTVMVQCGRVDGDDGAHWLQIDVQLPATQICIKRMDTMETACENLK